MNLAAPLPPPDAVEIVRPRHLGPRGGGAWPWAAGGTGTAGVPCVPGPATAPRPRARNPAPALRWRRVLWGGASLAHRRAMAPGPQRRNRRHLTAPAAGLPPAPAR
jgi:hypothetical protein